MRTQIHKEGDDFILEIPQSILDAAQISVGETVDITVMDDRIVIQKTKPDYPPLKERMAGCDTSSFVFEEIETGQPVGREIIDDGGYDD